MVTAWLVAAAMAGCAETPLVPESLGADPSAVGCGRVAVRGAGRVFATTPAEGLARGVALVAPRLELTAGAPGDVSARIALVAEQTGGTAGYLAVAGEAWLPLAQVVEARWDWKQAGLAVAGGLVDDPWALWEHRTWMLRPVALGMAQRAAFIQRSDVGGWLGWTAPDGWLSANLSLQSGEGWRQRERNNGINTALQVIGRPLGDDRLEIMAFGREGSRGTLWAQDHRAGVSVVGGPTVVRFGASALFGWGLDADATRRPLGVSVWGRTHDQPVVGWARVDHTREVRGDSGSGLTTLFAGAGPRLPPGGGGSGTGPASLVLGGEAELPADQAGPTAGRARPSYTVFVQLTAQVQAAWAAEEAP